MPSSPKSDQLMERPIAFKIDRPAPTADDGTGSRRVVVRALAGMQKEAIVSGGSGGAWRLLCDEGPYLNGTDLAPFPLGYFAAGQITSLASAVLKSARDCGIPLQEFAIHQSNRYTMQGSFLRGDATGGALPPELEVQFETTAEPADVGSLVRSAAGNCAALRILRERVSSVFTLTHNRVRVPLRDQASCSPAGDPADEFISIQPTGQESSRDLITKLATAEVVAGVPGGAGSSLQTEQNRTLKVIGHTRVLAGDRLQTDVGLSQPIGSRFRFLGHAPAQSEAAGFAPDPVDHLAAGVAFCFMTQLGRYAHIRKLHLRSCRLVQFSRLAPRPFVATHVFLDSDLDDRAAVDLVQTAQRTCFLHAALRSALDPTVSAHVNSSPIVL